jgi:hypothetical protein
VGVDERALVSANNPRGASMTPTDIIKRAFDNTVANWQLLLVRIALSVVILVVAVGAVVAMVIPLAVSAGLSRFDPRGADAPEILLTLLAEHWLLLLYIVIVASVLLAILCYVYSFAQSGSARIYLDAEAAAGAAVVGGRSRFAVFDPERWFRGAVGGAWRVFWIYNIAWTLALAIVLVPLVFVPAIMYLGGGTAVAIVAGCGLLLVIGAGFALLVLVTDAVIWKAIAIAIGRGLSAVDSLRAARTDFRADFSRNFTVVFILLVLHVGGAGILSILSLAGSVGQHVPGISLMFVPTRIVSSLVQAVFSAFMESWMLAAFVAIDAERNRSLEKPQLRDQPSVVTEVIPIKMP